MGWRQFAGWSWQRGFVIPAPVPPHRAVGRFQVAGKSGGVHQGRVLHPPAEALPQFRESREIRREVHDDLQKESGYTTTLKQMQLMLGKRLLTRTERFGAHVYEAGIPKEQTQKQIVGDLLNRAFEGSARGLVLGALAAKPTSADDLAEIKRMIEAATKAKGKVS